MYTERECVQKVTIKANITCTCAVPLYIISLHILALFWVVFDFRLNNCTCLCKDYKPSIEFINDK